MKSFYGIALLAVALGASAQSSYNPLTYSQSNGGPQYTTIDVYEDCTDTAIGTDTVTSTVVQTTCPLCSLSGMAGTMNPTHTTVYTTIYQTLCSTGLAPATYTITETCTGATPSWSQGPNYVPPGYTQTVAVCTVCGPSPTQVTMTVPCTACNNASKTNTPTTNTASAPMNGMKGTITGPTTTTTTVCPGSSICHPTTSTTPATTPTITRSTPAPYTAAATPLAPAQAWAGLMGGALAVAGAALL